jgi:hypothetical protein
MFNFFKKKDPGPVIREMVWFNLASKKPGCLQMVREKPHIVFIAWFDETLHEYTQFFESQGVAVNVVSAREINTSMLTGRMAILLEHHPLRNKTIDLLNRLGLKEITIMSALDDAILRQFGGDRLQSLMQKMGMDNGTPIEHSMLASSLAKAQDKIAQKVVVEQSARSMNDWMTRNVGVI